MIALLGVLALAVQGPVDFLAQAGAGPGLSPDWKVRAVRGRSAPMVEVRRDGDGPALRLEGVGKAAWFYHEPRRPITGAGMLRWSWCVAEAPSDADLRWKKTDDSPIRVFVVFGESGRSIFYSFGNVEPEGYEGVSHAGARYHVIRRDGADSRTVWRDHAADPFADYRRIWRGRPPPITAVGVMQDTDQTNQRAIAVLRRLEWAPGAGT
jgi:hypothetical protein